MDRFRLLQMCNKNEKGRMWVCPWLRVTDRDPFDEWIVELTVPLKVMGGVDYFVDINFERVDIAVTPVGSMQWVFFTKSLISDIRRPETEDYDNLVVHRAPRPPWMFTTGLLS